MGLLVCNWHYLRPSFPAQGIHGETPEQFRDQLERLAKIGTFVAGAQVRDGNIPERAILVTFDDGLREQYEYAWPILQQMGIPALFFVNTQPIAERIVLDVHKLHQIIAQGLSLPSWAASAEATAKYPYDTPEIAAAKHYLNVVLTPSARTRHLHGLYALLGRDEAAESRALYMTHAQLEDLADHGSLGTHGHDHEVSPHGFSYSQSLLQQWTARWVWAVSYPFGHRIACNPDPARGFDLGFTMERGVNHDLSRPLLLGRISCADLPDAGPLDALWDLPRCVWA